MRRLGTFLVLRAGSTVGERRVATATLVPYPYAFTYDILPASDTGTYVAAGALIGSTLRSRMHHDSTVRRADRQTCVDRPAVAVP